jgi:hypothetical protein
MYPRKKLRRSALIVVIVLACGSGAILTSGFIERLRDQADRIH